MSGDSVGGEGKSRDNLKKLRAFVIVVGVIGIAQGIAAGALAMSDDDPASSLLQLVVAAVVAIVGVTALRARRKMLDRPWRVQTSQDLAAGYAARLVIQVILALGSATIAYAGAIVAGAPWIVGIGLVLLLAPLRQALPTRRNLAKIQAWLEHNGCPHDLVESLRTPA